jgi:VCBS repeat-containing protein
MQARKSLLLVLLLSFIPAWPTGRPALAAGHLAVDRGSEASGVAAINAAPVVDAGPDATIDEGSEFASSGSFTDPDSFLWIATVNYGEDSDDSTLTLNFDGTFELNHTYPNDGAFTVTVEVSDFLETGVDTVTVTVNNVAPSVDAGPDGTINQGETFTSSGSFADPGDDSWTGTVDYGDGSAAEALALAEDKNFSLSHTYSTAGTFTVTVTIDDSAADSTDTATVVVAGDGSAPTDISLSNSEVSPAAAAGTPVGTFTTTDADSGDTHTYALVPGEGDEGNGFFSISEDSLLTGASLDSQAPASYSVRVESTDSGGLSFQKAFTITVLGENEPPVALGESYDALNTESLAVSTADGVLANDSDPEGEGLTAVLASEPEHAETFSLNPDGSFTYIPEAAFLGEDVFTYYAEDPDGLASETVAVLISVLDVSSPQVEWVLPAAAGKTVDVKGQAVLLKVEATDEDEIDYVHFYRWNAVDEVYVELAVVDAPPYELVIDTGPLHLRFNQVFAQAFDRAGNSSGRKWIWLYRLPVMHLPVVQLSSGPAPTK